MRKSSYGKAYIHRCPECEALSDNKSGTRTRREPAKPAEGQQSGELLTADAGLKAARGAAVGVPDGSLRKRIASKMQSFFLHISRGASNPRVRLALLKSCSVGSTGKRFAESFSYSVSPPMATKKRESQMWFSFFTPALKFFNGSFIVHYL